MRERLGGHAVDEGVTKVLQPSQRGIILLVGGGLGPKGECAHVVLGRGKRKEKVVEAWDQVVGSFASVEAPDEPFDIFLVGGV